jgi:rubrerythrin
MHADDIVEVYIAASAPEAHFLRNMLIDAGINAQVIGGTISSSLGLPAGVEAAPAVLVHRNDEAKAREILSEWEKVHRQPHRDDDEPRPAWRCPTCGELVDEDYELCWSCQTPRKPY